MNEPKWLKSLRDAAKDSDDDALISLLAIGEDLAKGLDALDSAAKAEDVKAKLDTLKEEYTKSAKEIDEKVEAGFEDVAKQLEDFSKRIEAKPVDATRGLVEALDENRRGKIYAAKELMRDEKRREREMDEAPEFYAAMDEWFVLNAMAQCKGPNGRWERNRQKTFERMENVEKALNAYAGMTKAAYEGGTDAEGGYAVPNIVGREIFRIVKDHGVVLPFVRTMPMTSDTLQVPNEFGDMTTYWVAEEGTLTQGENTFGQNTLNATKLAFRATWSIEFMEDNVVGALTYIRQKAGEDLARELDQEILEGDGTNFTGLNAETNINTVSTTTTDGEALAYGDLVSTYVGATESSTRVTSRWFMHPRDLAEVLKLADDQNMPIFPGAMLRGPLEGLIGRPLHTTSVISTTTTRGATGNTSNLYFGPPERLVLGVRNDFRWDVTDQVNWATYQMDGRLVGRFGFTVAKPQAFTRLVGMIAT